MTITMTKSFPEYIIASDNFSKNDITNVSRLGESEQTIQFPRKSIKNVEEVVMELLRINRQSVPDKLVGLDPTRRREFYSENRKDTYNTQLQNDIREIPVTKTINYIMENPAIEIIINQKIEKLKNDRELGFFPMNPSSDEIIFDFDKKNNLIIHQKLQYKEYVKCSKDGGITEQYTAQENSKPFVTVDFYIKLSANGNVIATDKNLSIEFNGCGNDLEAIFDQRTLWLKICDYFRYIFNFNSDVSGMNFMVPDFNNKRADEPGEKNNPIVPKGKNESSTSSLKGGDISMETLFPGLDKIPVDNFDKITIALNSELNSKIEVEREKLKKYNE